MRKFSGIVSVVFLLLSAFFVGNVYAENMSYHGATNIMTKEARAAKVEYIVHYNMMENFKYPSDEGGIEKLISICADGSIRHVAAEYFFQDITENQRKKFVKDVSLKLREVLKSRKIQPESFNVLMVTFAVQENESNISTSHSCVPAKIFWVPSFAMSSIAILLATGALIFSFIGSRRGKDEKKDKV